jgi:hypothetical protein
MGASPRLNASSSSSSDRYASVPLELAGEGRAVDLATALPAGVDLWRFLGCITTHNELPPWEGTECDLDNLDDSTLPPFGSVAYAKEVYRRRGYLPALVHRASFSSFSFLPSFPSLIFPFLHALSLPLVVYSTIRRTTRHALEVRIGQDHQVSVTNPDRTCSERLPMRQHRR